MTPDNDVPSLDAIAHRMPPPVEESVDRTPPVTVAEYRREKKLDTVATASSLDIAAEIRLPSRDNAVEWYDSLSATERYAVLGDRNTLRAGSPVSNLSSAATTDRVSVDRLPASRIEKFSVNTSHNLQTVRKYYTNTDTAFGLPVTAELGCASSPTRRSRVPVIDAVRFLWAAYTGDSMPKRSGPRIWSSDRAEEYTLRSHTSTAEPVNDTATAERATAVPQISAAATPQKPSTAPVRRSNGQMYYPRRLVSGGSPAEALYDIDMLRRARTRSMSVLLYGEPGTGKTALVEAAFDDVLTSNGHGDFEVSDFFGSFIETADRQFVWIDGQLLRAAKLGLPFFVDDASLIDPRVMSVLYPAMDGRREINVTTNPEIGVVQTHPDFYVVAACNPNAPGSVMSEAFLSRFALHVEVTTDFELMKRLGVPENVVIAAENLSSQTKNGSVVRAPQARDLLDYSKVCEEFGQKVAVANLLARADQADREAYRKALRATFGSNVVPLAV